MPVSDKKGHGVWILEENKPKRIPVSLGISDGNYTELVAGKIREGQKVIVVNGKVKVYQFRELKSVPPTPMMVVL